MNAMEDFKAFELAVGAVDTAVVLPFGTNPRILYVRPPHACTRADFAPLMQRVVNAPDLPPTLPTLWDLRGQTFADCSAESCRSMAFALGRYTDRQAVRRGILVDSDSGYGSGRMFQQTVDAFRIESQDNFLVSGDAEEIIAWLSAQA